jgi:hypothetical protein
MPAVRKLGSGSLLVKATVGPLDGVILYKFAKFGPIARHLAVTVELHGRAAGVQAGALVQPPTRDRQTANR